MDNPTTANLRIRRFTPRNLEMLERLMLGQKPGQIAREMGLTINRVSIIINSPLFKLELKRKMMRREEKLVEIQENILEGAKLGTQFQKELLEAPPGAYPTELKVRVGTQMTLMAFKMMQTGGGNGEEAGGGTEVGEGQTYEERLRKVTIEETFKTVSPSSKLESSPLDQTDYPPDDNLLLEEKLVEEEMEEELGSQLVEVEMGRTVPEIEDRSMDERDHRGRHGVITDTLDELDTLRKLGRVQLATD